jgi:DNA-binding NarL/FixJ family response regulator
MLKILIIASDSAFRSSLRSLFEAHQEFTVCGDAGDVAEAIKKAKKLRPGLIILDEALPSMNGYESAEALRSVLPSVHLFLLVDQHSFEVEVEALSHGAHAVFAKEDLTPLISNARVVCSSRQSEGGNGNGSAT